MRTRDESSQFSYAGKNAYNDGERNKNAWSQREICLKPSHAIAVHLTIATRRYAVANVVIPDTDKPALKSEKFPIHYFR